MVLKISGKCNPIPRNYLSINNTKITGKKKDKANKLGKTFSKNSSSENNKQEFQIVKNNIEKYKLNFNLKNLKEYDEDSSRSELENSLETARGPNKIHCRFLRQILN